MIFAIAYSDQNGRDFSKTTPWILDGFETTEECKQNAEELKLQGFRNVTAFAFRKAELREEEIAWEFARTHQI